MKIACLALVGVALTLPLRASESSAPPAVDPAALAPLKRMSETLTGAKALTYRMKNVLEVPAETGQFLTLFSAGDVALRRPDRLRVRLAGDAPALEIYYDGSTVLSFAPATGVYSRAVAPPTVDAMLAGLQAETGIRFASAPLLGADPYAALTRGLRSAMLVGPATVDGAACQHLAFRSPGVNWEIWLEANDRALPRRLAVTFTDRPNFPRTLVEFSRWNLQPLLSDGAFTFRPPAGTRELPFTSVLRSADR